MGPGGETGSAFPNCTLLNHGELPPPFLSRRGQFDELSVFTLTEGNEHSAE